jgi:hypothetical protein
MGKFYKIEGMRENKVTETVWNLEEVREEELQLEMRAHIYVYIYILYIYIYIYINLDEINTWQKIVIS